MQIYSVNNQSFKAKGICAIPVKKFGDTHVNWSRVYADGEQANKLLQRARETYNLRQRMDILSELGFGEIKDCDTAQWLKSVWANLP